MKSFRKLSTHHLAWIYIVTLLIFAIGPYLLYKVSIWHLMAFGVIFLVGFFGLLLKKLQPQLIEQIFQKFLFIVIGLYFALVFPIIKKQSSISINPKMDVQLEWIKNDNPLNENPVFSQYLYVLTKEVEPETITLPIIINNFGNETARNAIVNLAVSQSNFEFIKCNHMKIIDTVDMDFVEKSENLTCGGVESYIVLSYRLIDPVMVHTSVFIDSISLITKRPFLYKSLFKKGNDWDYAIIRTETSYDKTLNANLQYSLLFVISKAATIKEKDFISIKLSKMSHSIAEGTTKTFTPDYFFH
jgi:hypothetical protein